MTRSSGSESSSSSGSESEDEKYRGKNRKQSRDQGELKITKIGSTKEEVIPGKKSGN